MQPAVVGIFELQTLVLEFRLLPTGTVAGRTDKLVALPQHE